MRFGFGRAGAAALAAAALAVSGCATGGPGTVPSPGRCAAIGAVLGSAGGAIGSNPRHTKDETQDIAVGAGVGAVAGAALGWIVCSAIKGPPKPPIVKAHADPAQGEAPLTVRFRGEASDPDGRIVSERWEFGDGTTAEGASATHTYERPGTYLARFTARDATGLEASDSVRIVVAQRRVVAPPPPAPPRVERRIVLRGVQFDFDSAELRPEARVILDEAVRILRENPDVRIEVAGHTDATGPEEYNQRLSERRARAVADYLAARGIDRSRLVVRGYGESRPVADNSTRDGRAQNRRVELNVLR